MLKGALYQCEKITAKIIRITTITGECMYLCQGNDAAVLIDTGVGFAGLRELTEHLTKLPLSVLLTHAHPDHMLGVSLFDKKTPVYLCEKDKQLLAEFPMEEQRMEYIKGILGKETCEELKGQLAPAVPFSMIPICDGQIWDLGGETVEAISLEGHTEGSMAFLLHQSKVLITGDGCALCTLLFCNERIRVNQYRQSLCKLAKRTDGKYEHLFISHRGGEGPVDTVHQAIHLCDEILSESNSPMPYWNGKEDVFFAYPVDRNRDRLDKKPINLVYHRAQV